ncbi:hypothetical protein [Saccharothrix sp. ST-888]|uniref:hypothetical protein n=1 Tax=Saccharothrix sp. ST-888 TaxID=1427391 RepID=UPI0005EBFD08|nr:hypothetical protein [Saccharothrix sp. ST-888]KJK59532.1 hypothetical protein UK12_03785 [Saccharothrix sp. ST-888]
MTTAQDLFTEGVRAHIAPSLRSMGFTGGEQYVFRLPDEVYRAQLRIRLGTVSEHTVRYTFELGLTTEDLTTGEPTTEEPQAGSAPGGPEHWHASIGELLPVGGEVWWEITAGPRWLVAVEDSIAAVRHYGLPELRRRLADATAAGTGAGTVTETYLTPAELEEVNAALLTAAVARIQRAELADRDLVLTGAWSRTDRIAREVLQGAAEGFLSAADERFVRVRCQDTLGRGLWTF